MKRRVPTCFNKTIREEQNFSATVRFDGGTTRLNLPFIGISKKGIAQCYSLLGLKINFISAIQIPQNMNLSKPCFYEAASPSKN
jgi:hypothetical protein